MTRAVQAPRRRGEPLVALAAIGLCWVAVRAFAWQSPFPPLPAVIPALPQLSLRAPDTRPKPGPEPGQPPPRKIAAPVRSEWKFAPALTSSAPRAGPTTRAGPLVPDMLPRFKARDIAAGPTAPPATPASSAVSLVPPGEPRAHLAIKRWGVDSWVAWRQGSGGSTSQPAGQPLASTYGSSQAGMLARIDLSRSPMRPQAYLRATFAPEGRKQSDLAIGIGARPVGAVPLRIQAEARATRSGADGFVRPAVLAVTELNPLELPFGLRGEGYAQGGYIAGRFATAFVDGQARLDRELVGAGPARIRLGAGAWGGAQRGAERLDAGPTVTLDLRESAVPARVSLDYRRRVAGNASPGSGLAVTLSTGF